MLNAVGAYKHLIAGPSKPNDVSKTGWDLNLLQKSENPENIYKITLKEPADKFITATVVWNRHYSSVYPFEPIPEKNANLRLDIWAIDPNDPNNDHLLDYSDSNVDNVEHIYSQADANYTNYDIVVSYSDVDDVNQIPAAQRYALAWNVGEKQDGDNIFWYDLNADGIVDKLDFAILVNNLLTSIKSPQSYLLGDINTDGVIDINDLQIFGNHKNRQADWFTENTPE